jgi:DNA-binding transcriptional LysR family regulator
MLELRRLRYFVAVAEARNFTRAAETLHVAQPALSRQLRLLEEELGVELMRRTTHTFELTEAGEHLLEHGRELLRAADALERTLRGFGAGEAGRIAVAYGTSAAYDTAPRLLAAVAQRLPELELRTRVASVAEVLAQISAGTLDVGIVRCPPDAPGLRSWLLREERQGALLHREHPLAAHAELDPNDLSEETLLLHPRDANPGHYDAVLALLDPVRPRLELRDVAVDFQHTPVLEGRAVTIVGESAQRSAPPELTWVPLRGPATLEVRLLARALNRPPAVSRFLEVALAIAGELGWH